MEIALTSTAIYYLNSYLTWPFGVHDYRNQSIKIWSLTERCQRGCCHVSTPASFSCSFVDSHWIWLHIWVVFLENWPMVCVFLFSRIKCTQGFHYEEGDSSHTPPYRHTYRWEFALQATLLNWDLIHTLNCMLLKGHHKGHLLPLHFFKLFTSTWASSVLWCKALWCIQPDLCHFEHICQWRGIIILPQIHSRQLLSFVI